MKFPRPPFIGTPEAVGPEVPASGAATASVTATGVANVFAEVQADGAAQASVTASGLVTITKPAVGAGQISVTASGFANVSGLKPAAGDAVASVVASGVATVLGEVQASGNAIPGYYANGIAQVIRRATGDATASVTASGFTQVGETQTAAGDAQTSVVASGVANITITEVFTIRFNAQVTYTGAFPGDGSGTVEGVTFRRDGAFPLDVQHITDMNTPNDLIQYRTFWPTPTVAGQTVRFLYERSSGKYTTSTGSPMDDQDLLMTNCQDP